MANINIAKIVVTVAVAMMATVLAFPTGDDVTTTVESLVENSEEYGQFNTPNPVEEMTTENIDMLVTQNPRDSDVSFEGSQESEEKGDKTDEEDDSKASDESKEEDTEVEGSGDDVAIVQGKIESAATVAEDAATIAEDAATIAEDAATIAEDAATVAEDAATVAEVAATVAEVAGDDGTSTITEEEGATQPEYNGENPTGMEEGASAATEVGDVSDSKDAGDDVESASAGPIIKDDDDRENANADVDDSTAEAETSSTNTSNSIENGEGKNTTNTENYDTSTNSTNKEDDASTITTTIQENGANSNTTNEGSESTSTSIAEDGVSTNTTNIEEDRASTNNTIIQENTEDESTNTTNTEVDVSTNSTNPKDDGAIITAETIEGSTDVESDANTNAEESSSNTELDTKDESASVDSKNNSANTTTKVGDTNASSGNETITDQDDDTRPEKNKRDNDKRNNRGNDKRNNRGNNETITDEDDGNTRPDKNNRGNNETITDENIDDTKSGKNNRGNNKTITDQDDDDNKSGKNNMGNNGNNKNARSNGTKIFAGRSAPSVGNHTTINATEDNQSKESKETDIDGDSDEDDVESENDEEDEDEDEDDTEEEIDEEDEDEDETGEDMDEFGEISPKLVNRHRYGQGRQRKFGIGFSVANRRPAWVKTQISPFRKDTFHAWPNATVPFVIVGSERTKKQVMKALAHISNDTCVKFVNRTTEERYVHIKEDDGGCWTSRIGYPSTDRKVIIGLGRGCRNIRVIVHEVMHALGFHHEHNRPDRNTYIKIDWSNIKKEGRWGFKLQNLAELGYDYKSIMHYGKYAFALNRTLPTIEPKQEILGSLGGKRLSELDKMKINFYYKC